LFAYFSGAEILEKHICFDRSTKPYDYYSSLEPEEFSSLVSELAKAKNIMGGIEITEAQKKYLTVASRALSISNIKLGQYILPEHIIYRRTSVQDAITPDISEKLIPGVALREILSLDPLKCGDIRKVKIVAVVPCRLGSSRLEKKAFAEIAGLPSIKRCIINTKQISFVDEVVLATSDNIVDDELVDYAKAENIKYVRGSEKNVLERIIKAGREYSADIVLRITGDCPVISFEMMEFMILDHLRKDADMSYSHSNIAVGTIGDVYKFSALERLYEIVPNAEYSEYLSYYFINNQNAFNVNDVSLPNIWQKPEWRLTLDEPADLTLLDRIVSYYNLGEEPISFRQIENYFLKFPEDVQINQGAKLKYKTDMRFIEHLNKSTSFDTIKLKEGY
jgi:N,N'-diacetyllegionaminate synthase